MAVERVSFDIAPGETLGLVGQSGSGKTTTGRAILQLQKVHRGSVKLLGEDLTQMSSSRLRRMRRHMQFVLQNPYSSLHPRMTIAQIADRAAACAPVGAAKQMRERVAELLELVNMDPAVMHRYPNEFSGGQRQRIVIARALAVNPDFVVCDEPVSALDVRTQAQIVALLQSLQDRLGLSYLFIAHDLADRPRGRPQGRGDVCGQIVEIGKASQVYDTPAHPYTQSLLDAVPIPEPALQRERLRRTPAEYRFSDQNGRDGPCPCGENHAATGTHRWHWIAVGHGISCEFWPESE